MCPPLSIEGAAEEAGVWVGKGTYSQMERTNRHVGLPLFQMEEGMVTNPFLG